MTGKPISPGMEPEPDPGGHRLSIRHAFRGEAFTLCIDRKDYVLRLKDLSCGGACGLLDEPLAVGDHVVVTLDTAARIEAEVRWVRRVRVGLRFTRPISPTLLKSLAERHASAAPQR